MGCAVGYPSFQVLSRQVNEVRSAMAGSLCFWWGQKVQVRSMLLLPDLCDLKKGVEHEGGSRM